MPANLFCRLVQVGAIALMLHGPMLAAEPVAGVGIFDTGTSAPLSSKAFAWGA